MPNPIISDLAYRMLSILQVFQILAGFPIQHEQRHRLNLSAKPTMPSPLDNRDILQRQLLLKSLQLSRLHLGYARQFGRIRAPKSEYPQIKPSFLFPVAFQRNPLLAMPQNYFN